MHSAKNQGLLAGWTSFLMQAEGPHRLLKEEVQQLRLEKDSVEVKLKDFEVSLQKLKECTYAEAAQRQEYEVTLRQVQAELRGGSLREQVRRQPYIFCFRFFS